MSFWQSNAAPSLWKILAQCFFAFIVSGMILLAPASTRAAAQSDSPAEKSTPLTIPLTEISPQAESATARMQDIRSNLASDRTIEIVSAQLPALAREINGRARESRRIVAQTPSIEMLRRIEGEWSRLRRELSALNHNLTDRVNEIERQSAQLDDLGKTWDQTSSAAKEANAPADVLGRIESVTTEVQRTHEAVEKQRGLTLTMLNRVGMQDSRIGDALRSLAQARENTLNRLFSQDGPPLWDAAAGLRSVQDLQSQSLSSFSTQAAELGAYIERQAVRFLLAGVILGVIAAALLTLRRHARVSLIGLSDVSLSTAVFESPLAASLVLAFLVSRWIFPEAPRLMDLVLGALVLVPSVIVLRRILTIDLRRASYALIACFVLDQLRAVAAAVEFLPRLLFVVEMFGLSGFLVWLMQTNRAPISSNRRLIKMLRRIGYAALAISSAAFMANIFGYVSLSGLIGNALLRSSYLALVLYAVVEILDGLTITALGLRPLAALAAVHRHRSLLRSRIRRALLIGVSVLWLIAGLQWLLLWDRLFNAAHAFLTEDLSIGSIHVSPGDVVAFGVTIWLAFAISRFIRFLLDEDIYPRAHLSRGLPYAISTTLHYLILVVGLFLAVGALGFDMTRVTILAGAFSVGVGFGLQNIFNNFISGLILLFERPVNIGDVVQIEDAAGVVERIGIRASVIRTTNGSDIIVPNGKLISERLTNWTLSSRRHGIELPVAVAQGTDAKRTMALLEQTAAAHPLIARDPPPRALVIKLGADALNFELRAWTDRTEQWMDIRSELAIAISSALAAEGVAIR